MEINNYIPISRKIFEHQFWCEGRVYSRFEAWLDLLQSTRFEDTKLLIGNRFIDVKRGQVPVSLRYLASRWNWGKNKVDNFFKLLELDKMITKGTAKGTGQTLITICNYDMYNLKPKKPRQPAGQEGDSSGTAAGQEGDKRNKDNKENNEKKEKYGDFDFSFIEFEFEQLFFQWLEYKKERKEKYKTQKSLELCYSNLKKLSNNNPKIAQEIVNQSLSQNWAGLFELKNNFSKPQQQSNYSDYNY